MGRNSFASTRWRANKGKYAVMMINVAKNIGLAIWRTARSASVSERYSFGLASRRRRTASTTMMGAFTIIPKSMAPSDRRFAGTLVKFIRMKAISIHIGMVMATISAL